MGITLQVIGQTKVNSRYTSKDSHETDSGETMQDTICPRACVQDNPIDNAV